MRRRFASPVCGALSTLLLLAGGSLRAQQTPAQPTLYADGRWVPLDEYTYRKRSEAAGEEN